MLRKPVERMDLTVKNRREALLDGELEVLRRWREYFEELLNVDEHREALISCIDQECKTSFRSEEEPAVSVGGRYMKL